MISPDAWRQNEPRLNFPIFGNAVNQVDFSIQEDRKLTIRRAGSPLYRFLTRKLGLRAMLRDYRNMVSPQPFTFRGVFIDRAGKQLCCADIPGAFHAGDFFYCDINEWLTAHQIPVQDGNFILVANRGLADRWQSSPGNVSLTVNYEDRITGYRTGFFARPLNAGNKHVGFTGLNPRVEVTDQWISGLLLINHSSDPGYDAWVNPTVRLYRDDQNYLEAEFGNIAPHAGAERSVLELFPEAEAFLAPSHGIGYTVTRLSGFSLASVHVLRTRTGMLAALEHSRPAHTNIINYL